jgi:heme-degrading monooxygenase HmoA
MIVVSNLVRVAAGDEAAFTERLRDRLGLVERHPGFVRLEVLRPEPLVLEGRQVGDSADHVVLTYWTGPEYFAAWLGSADFQRAHAQRAATDPFAGPASFEVHRLVQTTEGRSAADK